MSVHPLFAPFCSPATIIKPDVVTETFKHFDTDTGAMQSLIKGTPGSTDFTDTGETRLLKGITNDTISVPLVEVHLHTNFINEKVLCGLVSELPDGIDFLIGNDIWLKGHPLSDEIIQQTVVTRSATLNAQTSSDTDDNHETTENELRNISD